MFEDKILKDFLENAVRKAKVEIKEKGVLTVENALPLLLDSQYNHIVHLTEDIGKINFRLDKVDERLGRVEGRLNGVEGSIIGLEGKIGGLEGSLSSMKYWFMFSIGFLGLVLPLLISLILKVK